MAYWLASERNGQDFDYVQRFDPRFWTIDFPRPMMASVVTTAADAMRVDLEFHHRDALAGLIWESVDRFDHPLLAYETDRDYSHTSLRFHWRSEGIVPLDEVNGPTLTIEGQDEAGNDRSWFVRLWNYADGSSEDAVIDVPFSDLLAGWELVAGGDKVNPSRIDRMFISLAPKGFDPGEHALLDQRTEAWVELTSIRCDGEHALLEIGDVLVPPHELRMATAYDDSYNLTPARILRMLRGLGYREDIVHYVGMSHYARLFPAQDGSLLAGSSGELAGPCRAWHSDFLERAHQAGYRVIQSLSYELFNEQCPGSWKQRFFDGSPALTGWDPPSTLLSPANEDAMGFLRSVATRFTRLALDAGMPIAFQIGEPWWWQSLQDRRICLYDSAFRDRYSAAFGGEPPEIANLSAPLTDEQTALLDHAGQVLGASVLSIRDRVREEAQGEAEIMILLFTPTVLDFEAPEAWRANVSTQWAWPQFDRLQLEDYDWLTEGAEALRRAAYKRMKEHLGYPERDQDYLAGFVLRAEDAQTHWRRIDHGIDEAAARGVGRCFVWALPQVARDGFIRLPASGDKKVQAFDDIRYPLSLGRDASVSPEFSTSVAVTASGHERRNSHWADARLRFDVGPGIRSEDELGTLIAFFRARRGAARGFRLCDPFDCSSNKMTGTPGPADQLIGTGDGQSARFALIKAYGEDPEPQIRRITRPIPGSVRVSVAGIETWDFEVEPGGAVVFGEAPPKGVAVRAGFRFDVPVRFAEDRLDVTGASFTAGDAPSVPLIEIREDA